MVLADALSRRPDLCPVEDHDNENVVLLPEDLFVALIDVELRDAVPDLKCYFTKARYTFHKTWNYDEKFYDDTTTP